MKIIFCFHDAKLIIKAIENVVFRQIILIFFKINLLFSYFPFVLYFFENICLKKIVCCLGN